MKVLSILFIVSLSLFSAKLTKSGDYVIDDTHKLMWQDSKYNTKIIVTQPHAEEYCEKLSQNGFHDWRLPTVEEYTYIIDKTRVKEELMINKAFKHVVKDDYWASDRTWIRNFGRYGYYVFLKSGAIYYQNRSYPKYVRCVRNLK